MGSTMACWPMRWLRCAACGSGRCCTWSTWGLFPGESDLLAPLTVFGLLAGGTLAAQCGSFLLKGRRAALAVALAGLVAVIIALYLGLEARTCAALGSALAGSPACTSRPCAADLLPAVGLWWWGLLAGRDRVSV